MKRQLRYSFSLTLALLLCINVSWGDQTGSFTSNVVHPQIAAFFPKNCQQADNQIEFIWKSENGAVTTNIEAPNGYTQSPITITHGEAEGLEFRGKVSAPDGKYVQYIIQVYKDSSIR